MKRLALLLVCLLSGLSLVGCGGGGGSAGGDANPTPPQEAETGLPASVSGSTTLVRLLSAKGDPVGDGQNYEYSLTNSTISVEVVGTSLRVVVLGDERWNAVFTPTTTPGPLKPLLVENVRRETVPGLQVGMDWSGESTRLCVVGTATISVDSVRYVEGQLKGLELRFEQRCGSTGSLRGPPGLPVPPQPPRQICGNQRQVPCQPLATTSTLSPSVKNPSRARARH
jgi:hypothetical protein